MLMECRDLVALLACYINVRPLPITLDLSYIPLLQEIHNRANDFSSDEHTVGRVHFGSMSTGRIQQVTSIAIDKIIKYGSVYLLD
jgi:hypothetical protein